MENLGARRTLLSRLYQNGLNFLTSSSDWKAGHFKLKLEELYDLISQIETEEERICTDLQKFDDPPYEVDVINSRLGYRIKDSVDWELAFGYRTAFAHLFELEHGKLVGGSATTSVCQLLYL